MRKKRYAVDKVCDGVITLIPDDGGDILKLPLNDYDLSENDVVDVTEEGDSVIDVAVCREQTEARLNRSRSRLHSLFGRNKK